MHIRGHFSPGIIPAPVLSWWKESVGNHWRHFPLPSSVQQIAPRKFIGFWLLKSQQSHSLSKLFDSITVITPWTPPHSLLSHFIFSVLSEMSICINMSAPPCNKGIMLLFSHHCEEGTLQKLPRTHTSSLAEPLGGLKGLTQRDTWVERLFCPQGPSPVLRSGTQCGCSCPYDQALGV